MKLSAKLYGCTGFIALLGLIGIFTEQRIFLAFFGFIVNFEYLFVKSDEMLNEYLNKSAAVAFYCGSVGMALATLIYYAFVQNTTFALIKGLAWGWIISIGMNAILIVIYSVKEKFGMAND